MMIDPEIIIARNLAGEASQEEKIALNQWIQEKPENRALYEEFQKCWEISGSWKSLDHKEVERSLAQVWEKTQSTGKSRIYNLSALYKLAAAVIIGIALLGGYFWLRSGRIENPQLTVVYSSGNQIKNLVLPDGSKVWMNRNTLLRTASISERNAREYILTGEAFFEVLPDSSRPFLIHAGNSLVRVVGTSFNVKNNSPSGNTEVLVETGKVRLHLGGEDSPSIILVPGELGIAAEHADQLAKTANSAENYLSWKTRCLVFRETSLDKVAASMAEVYNVSIQFSDPSIARLRFTSQFENSTVSEVFDVLKLAFPQLDVLQEDSGHYSIVKK